MAGETLVSAKDAAVLLRVSNWTYVHTLIRQGRLPKRTLNGQAATTLEGVIKYLSERDERRGGRKGD